MIMRDTTGGTMRQWSGMILKWLVFAGLFVTISCSEVKPPGEAIGHSPGLVLKDRYTLAGKKNLYSGYQPIDSRGNIHVIVEIPSGTNGKWEVSKSSGNLEREFKNGAPRVVEYLSYPGNYGMIPRTLLPEESGGDGDPLDVIVLGPAVPRGTVLKARLIGMIRMLDGGEQDDKLIAVMLDSHFGGIRSLEGLESRYKGVTRILDLWFSNYKGPGVMQSDGTAGAEEAETVLQAAIDAYAEQKALAAR